MKTNFIPSFKHLSGLLLILTIGLMAGNVTAFAQKAAPTAVTPLPAISLVDGPRTEAYVFQLRRLIPGDFNGDGNQDLLVLQDIQTVQVLLGDGAGNLSAINDGIANYPINTAGAITVGDFNGDGILDVAALGTNNQLTILSGDGKGHFPVAKVVNVAFDSIATGDFNGDGHLDLAAGTGGVITVVLGDGAGNFTVGPVTKANQSTTPAVLAVGDFNGDGKLDLAMGNPQDTTPGGINILLGNGKGSFTVGSNPANGLQPQSLVTADFNRDGKLDLASGNSDGSITILLGGGTGTFTSSSIANPGNSFALYSLVTADFNGDGIADLAAVGSAGVVSIYTGNGAGQFKGAAQRWPSSFSQPGIDRYHYLAVGEFNNDGRPDLATIYDIREGDQIEALFTELGGAEAFITPQSFNFGDVTVMSSASQSVTIANAGTQPLSITGYPITIYQGSADFSATPNCATTIAPGASCTLQVKFAPLTVETASGWAVITDSSSNIAPMLISGNGIGGAKVTVSPASVAFGNQAVGSSSAGKFVTIQNTGSTDVHPKITASGDFVLGSSTCSLVAAGGSCELAVSFAPKSAGMLAGQLQVVDEAGTQTVALSGTGVGTGPGTPAVKLSATTLNFTAKVGKTSAAQTVTMTNSGSADLKISAISLIGKDGTDFTLTNHCGSKLAAGASCTFAVKWTAYANGVFVGAVKIVDNAPDTPQRVNLKGTSK